MQPREISRAQGVVLSCAAVAALVCSLVLAGLVPARAAAAVPAHGRAWELVSPGAPVGATIENARVFTHDGTRVTYASVAPLPGAPAGDVLANSIAARGPDGWTSVPVGSPYSVETFSLGALLAAVPLAFSEDLSTSLWKGNIPLNGTAPPPEERPGLYRVEPDGTVTPLMVKGEFGEFVAASRDLSRTVFRSEQHLVPPDSWRESGSSIYEYDGSGITLVDQSSAGTLLSSCGSEIGETGAVSESADRIFFVNPGRFTECTAPSRLYLREGGSRTVEVSASQCTRPDCDAAQPVSFAGATPSGSFVFLTTTQQLTNSDTDERRDLYRYDVETGALVEISNGPDEAVGEVVGESTVWASADGSHVYFAARGSLVPGDGAAEGENLYLADASGLHLVAPISVGEETFRISRDGETALIVTQVPLVPGDTDGQPDVYLYDARSGTFTWLSQGPSGGNGEFPARITSPIESFVFGLRPENRAMSEDGSRVFFSTKEPLLPEDVNEATDVYEWAEGSLGLVSPGTGEAEAEFAGASADGGTVLFRTTESLLPSDQDGGEADLYAARLGGGFDESGPAAPPAGCAEICGPPVPAPARGPNPRSAGHQPRPGKGGLRLRSVAGAASRMGAGRPAPIDVWVPVGGRVSATATIAGRSGVDPAGSGVAGAIRRGPVRIWLRGTERARRVLLRDGSLPIRLEVREAKLRLTRHVRLRLGGQGSAGRGS